jgi:hypothetical protein
MLSGAALALEFGYGLAKFGGHEYLPRATTLAIVRTQASGISTSALLFALVVWSHGLSTAVVRSNLAKAMAYTLLVATPCLAIATVLAVVTSFAVAHLGYAVPGSAIGAGIRLLGLDDFVYQFAVFPLEAALVGAVCWLAIPWLARSRWSLIAKLAAGWLGMSGLRLVLSIVVGVIDA